MVSPATRRRGAQWIRERFAVSERRACRLAAVSRSTARYVSNRKDQELSQRITELAAERPRFGYRRIFLLLRREGWSVNLKRVHRIYRSLGLAVRRKKRKRVAQANRRPRQVPAKANEQWSMDFMSDSLADGRTFRTLNNIDDSTRECLALEAGTSLGGNQVVRVLNHLIRERGKPSGIVVDNGTEFTSKTLDQWAYEHQVELRFIHPGCPIENCFVESFNGRFRDECLNLHWFVGLAQARRIIEGWRYDYNHTRPHSSLGGQTPSEFAARLLGRRGRQEEVAA
jgi:putative transposase